MVLTGAGGSKLSLLGFADITCSIGKFTFTEEFAVINGMVSDMLLGIRWEHRYNIHTGWTRNGNHYISRGKHDFIAESTFEPIDESINEIRETNWTELDGRMRQAHQQLRKKKSYRKARQEYFKGDGNHDEMLRYSARR